MAVRDDHQELKQRVEALEGELASLDAQAVAKEASFRDPLQRRLDHATREVESLRDEVEALDRQQQSLEKEALATSLGAGLSSAPALGFRIGLACGLWFSATVWLFFLTGPAGGVPGLLSLPVAWGAWSLAGARNR